MKHYLLFLLTLGVSLDAIAQGDLLVSPLRVVFEGKKSKELINVTNTSKDTALYVASFVQYKMEENGQFTQLPDTDRTILTASPFLRIFPKKVILAPGESQTIILQYRRTPEMANGEYRSHLYLRSENREPPRKSISGGESELSIKLTAIFGLAIPIIIRNGQPSISVSISDIKLSKTKEGTPILQLVLNRTGNISSFGDIKVDFIPSKGKPQTIGRQNGVGVYTCISKRNLAVVITPSSRDLSNGKLKVTYTNAEEGKKGIIAENEVDI